MSMNSVISGYFFASKSSFKLKKPDYVLQIHFWVFFAAE